MSKRIIFILVPVAVLVIAAAVVVSLKPFGGRQYNVLLVSVDTLRPDRLGYHGHTRDTSPAIDALAREGVVFEHCYSQSGWTLPSIATVLTGMYPRDHGATDFHWAIDEKLPTMARILRGQGYDTRGYVSHVFLKPQYGVADGFSSFDYSVLKYGHPHKVTTGRQLTDVVITDIATITEPFFVWVHYFDPHYEYVSHEQWASFGESDLDRYDGEIAFTDYHIARIFEYLRQRRMFDNTIVIFLSDHGEEFGEHDGYFHYTLYEEVLKTPLVIKAPHLEPGVNGTLAEQIDILPTLLTLMNIELPAGLPGRDLLGTGGDTGPIFVERDRPPPYNLRGVISGGYKLIVVDMADRTGYPERSLMPYEKEAEVVNVHPGVYLYNLDEDPGEQHNIYTDDHPKAVELMKLLADHFAGERPAVREVDVDEKLREKLRSLGYIR